jgi:enterochelin esterase family protein
MANQLPSPTLSALTARLADGDDRAGVEFWEAVEADGSPLIEPCDDPRELLVTVVYRSDKDEDLVVIGGLSGLDSSDNHLKRLNRSDVWYGSYRVPSTLRTLYAFAAPGVMDPAAMRQDSYNPRSFVFPAVEDADFPGVTLSLVELPDAPPLHQRRSRTARRTGKVEVHRLESARLGNTRRVHLYRPPNYRPTAGPYPLLVLLDGDSFTQAVSAPTLLDNLIAEGAVPPMAAVLPESLDEPTRVRELGLNRLFNDFVADELLPWARARLAITADPTQVTVAGASLGGLAATYLALERPDVAGNVISLSGAYQWSPEGDDEPVWMARHIAGLPRASVRFWLAAGIAEQRAYMSSPSLLAANRHLRDVLRAAGYEVDYREYPGGHDLPWWQEELGEALIALNNRPYTG